jgi:branched-chain amino acid transport system substrate-binding protein
VFGTAAQEGTPIGSLAEYRIAVQAAVDYLNAERGGIQGHRIQLETCATKATPETNQACAHQLVDKQPLAVLGTADYLGASAIPVYAQAGVPILGGGVFTPPELTYPKSVRFVGWVLSAFPALAVYAADVLHAHKLVVVARDTPGTKNIFEHYIKPVLLKKGLAASDINFVIAPTLTADWTPFISEAASQHPDAMLVLTTPDNCLAILRAHAAVAPSVKLVNTDECTDPALLQQAGATAEGVAFASMFRAHDESDTDYRTYQMIVKRYAHTPIPYDAFSIDGINTVMNVWETLDRAGPSALTRDGVLAPFKSAGEHHNFLAHAYTCDGSAVPVFPTVCDAHGTISVVRNGRLVDSGQWLFAADLIG